VAVLTEVPDELSFRGIPPPENAGGFGIALDAAQPWGGGTIEGRVERKAGRRSPRPVTVAVRCEASWLDVAPQLVGRKRLLSITTYWDIRSRSVPIWLDEIVFLERQTPGTLAEANWLHFVFTLPEELPRALEGTFVAFRWRIEATRPRQIGLDRASLPIIVRERQPLPVVRTETSPLGSWRLLEWKSEGETEGSAGPCAVSYDERRPEDMPRPGETRETELARRFAG
jgi:hypothetical protein